MPTIVDLRAQVAAAESNVQTDEGRDAYAALFGELYDALGAALGFDRHPDSGYFVDGDGLLCKIETLEALYDASMAER